MAWGDPLKGGRRLAERIGSGQVSWRGPWVFLGEDMTSRALTDRGLKPRGSTPWLGHWIQWNWEGRRLCDLGHFVTWSWPYHLSTLDLPLWAAGKTY